MTGGPPVFVPGATLVLPEKELLGRLSKRLSSGISRQRAVRSPAAAGGLIVEADSAVRRNGYRFGRRRVICAVKRRGQTIHPYSTMEEDAEGWQFTLPIGGRACLVQRVLALDSAGWECAPYLTWPVAGNGWFRCGPSAIAMDPICGDGAGYAARAALWVSALADALREGADPAEVAAQYNTRIALAFRGHLRECLNHYAVAPFSSRWRHEIRETERGIAALDRLCVNRSPLQWGLAGLDAI